ncbi:unnamed protein product [Sphagnum balticum]
MAIIAPSSSSSLSSSSWCSTLLGWHQVVACSSPSMHLLKFNSVSVFSSPRTPPSSSPALQLDALEALVFDCDGVILESEDLHRRAYNAAFHHFNVCCPQSPEPLVWTSEFYDELQNQIGGGKPKMRWYFNKNGWPTSTISSKSPVGEQDQATVIDTIQDWKTDKYKDIIRSGAVEPRPGVLRLMDEARVLGLKISVCSAATKSSVIFCLTNLLGKERFEALDCFLAGDDVDKKKPDPSIYRRAAEVLGVAPGNCLVVEDSVIGLQAACGAGMSCIISYTSSTSKQDFGAAKAVYPDLGSVSIRDLVELVEGMPATF